jgi:hypothetical protein
MGMPIVNTEILKDAKLSANDMAFYMLTKIQNFLQAETISQIPQISSPT